MRNIIYYVATSIDGFICGPNDDISDFASEGNGLEKYRSDLLNFDTVIMGKRTYEFGYRFGLLPGRKAYPHMKHYIFSRSLHFESHDSDVNVCPPDLQIVQNLKNEKGSDIYLCGGGHFAGWMLDNEQIDFLTIKLNPVILGKGTRLFGKSDKAIKTSLLDTHEYDKGLQIITYKIRYQ